MTIADAVDKNETSIQIGDYVKFELLYHQIVAGVIVDITVKRILTVVILRLDKQYFRRNYLVEKITDAEYMLFMLEQ